MHCTKQRTHKWAFISKHAFMIRGTVKDIPCMIPILQMMDSKGPQSFSVDVKSTKIFS